MGNTKKKGPGQTRRLFSCDPDIDQFLNWLSKQGYNYSLEIRKALRAASKYREFLDETKHKN